MVLMLRVFSNNSWFQCICSSLLIFRSTIVRKKFESRKVPIKKNHFLMASTLFLLIFLNLLFFAFFPSLGSNKKLTGPISLCEWIEYMIYFEAVSLLCIVLKFMIIFIFKIFKDFSVFVVPFVKF